MPVVSIVVPVYKVRDAYLRQCIDSLMQQTLTDIEIILVDDGSPDNCGAVCDEYAKKDSRIVVIHQENQGISMARNNGMQAATGKWLAFVDADDWVELDMYQGMVDYAEKHALDVLLVAGYKNYVGKEYQNFYPWILPNHVYRASDNAAIMLDIITSSTHASRNSRIGAGVPWGKLIRRELVIQNRLTFPAEIPFGEDKLFILDLLLKADAVAYWDRCYYHYRAMAVSASTRYRSGVVQAYINYLHWINSFIELHFSQDRAFRSAYRVCVVGSICRIAERIRGVDSLTYAQKKKELLYLIQQEPFASALQTLGKSELLRRTYAQVWLLKRRWFGFYLFLKTAYLYASGRKESEIPFV